VNRIRIQYIVMGENLNFSLSTSASHTIVNSKAVPLYAVEVHEGKEV